MFLCQGQQIWEALVRLTKKTKKGTNKHNWTWQRSLITDTTEIQGMRGWYYEQVDTNKLNQFEEMEKISKHINTQTEWEEITKYE